MTGSREQFVILYSAYIAYYLLLEFSLMYRKLLVIFVIINIQNISVFMSSAGLTMPFLMRSQWPDTTERAHS